MLCVTDELQRKALKVSNNFSLFLRDINLTITSSVDVLPLGRHPGQF